VDDSNGVPFFESGDEGHILRDGEMRKEAGILNNVADTAAKTNGIAAGGCAAFNQNLSLRGNEQAVDEPEEGGFATAAAAEKDQGLAA
jgi:hypothetical protein